MAARTTTYAHEWQLQYVVVLVRTTLLDG